MSQPPVASVIFTTYNQPAWLEKTLLGFAAQDRSDFEVIVGDDGSGEETRNLIERLRPQLPFALQHVWQEDLGFRKCQILNAAIRASRSDYIIVTDGDCIPRRDFVSTHLALRRPGCYLSGGYFKLPMDISQAITPEDIRQGRCFDLPWLRRMGLKRGLRNLRLAVSGSTARLLDRLSRAHPSWNGHNSSGWKADIEAVNGFDERMGYGGEDRELGYRLRNHGVRPVRIRYRAIALHLDHPRGYADPKVRAVNEGILSATERQRLSWTAHGLVKSDARPVRG